MERVDHREDRLDGRSLFMLDLTKREAWDLLGLLEAVASSNFTPLGRSLALKIARQLEEALAEDMDGDA